MQIIEEVADEGSSFYPRIDFKDEDGAPVTPTAITWKLTDLAGNVINSRAAVSETPTTTYISLALGGADLACMGKDLAPRLITLWGTYVSATFGADRPYKIQALFNIQPTVGE